MSAPEPKRCLGCGYILEYLPEPRCPECGRGFDPDDPDTYMIRAPSGRRYLAAAVLPLAAMAAMVGYFVGNPPEALVIAFIGGGSPVEGVVLVGTIRALRRPQGTIRYRGAFVLALLISLFYVVGLFLGVFLPAISRI